MCRCIWLPSQRKIWTTQHVASVTAGGPCCVASHGRWQIWFTVGRCFVRRAQVTTHVTCAHYSGPPTVHHPQSPKRWGQILARLVNCYDSVYWHLIQAPCHETYVWHCCKADIAYCSLRFELWTRRVTWMFTHFHSTVSLHWNIVDAIIIRRFSPVMVV